MNPPDPTRRDFLLKLAKTMAFVPPAMATIAVRPLAGQGKSGGTTTTTSSSSSTTSSSSETTTTGGGKGSGSSSVTTVGSISPTAAVRVNDPGFNLEPQQPSSPWNARRPGQPPPWSRPPPTQTGR